MSLFTQNDQGVITQGDQGVGQGIMGPITTFGYLVYAWMIIKYFSTGNFMMCSKQWGKKFNCVTYSLTLRLRVKIEVPPRSVEGFESSRPRNP